MRSIWRRQADGLRRRINRIRQQKTSGFTLVELIVVLVVLGILCSLAVMSIIGWQDHADFKQQNEYAQNLFSAAQIQLTQYAERGQLTELVDEIIGDGSSDPSEYLVSANGTLTGSDGNPIDTDSDKVWGTDKPKGNIYYLMAKKGDYSHYIKDLKGKKKEELTDPADRRLKALFDMIDPYVADKEMLDAAICIEFDPDPRVALVYSVFYNQKANEFTYGELSDPDTKKISIHDRREQERKNDKTGYYGAETMSKGTVANQRQKVPVISGVQLKNEDTLNLNWTVDDGDALKSMIYQIDLFAPSAAEGGDGKRLATVTLGKPGEKLGSGTFLADCNVILPDPADPTKWLESQSMKFPVTLDEVDRTVRLVLDALDLYADESATQDALTASGSAYRLGLDTDEIYCMITGTPLGSIEKTAVRRSNDAYLYFGEPSAAETSAPADTKAYSIDNARHLNNIRYYEKAHAGEIVEYHLNKDIDWAVFLKNGQAYQGLKAIEGNNLVPFKPILSLGKKSTFTTTDGTEEGGDPHVLNHFQLEYGADTMPKIDKAAEDAGVTPHTIGLFVLNRGIIKNITLQKISVMGDLTVVPGAGAIGATGAFCGKNQGKLEKLTVESGQVTGSYQVGGIMGEVAWNDNPAQWEYNNYKELVNKAAVTGNYYVGGIVGRLYSDEKTNELVVTKCSNCSNYGKVRGTKDSYFIGGIVGACEVRGAGNSGKIKLDNCNSSPAYTKDEIGDLVDLDTGKISDLTGTYVGGIVGFNQGADLIDCSTLRENVETMGYVIGMNYVGGIAGVNAGTSENPSSELVGGTGGRNQANVIGKSYVGGIVGCNARVEVDKDAGLDALDQIKFKTDAAENIAVRSWKNEGVVLATEEYSGGITGCNYGAISDCTSDVEYNAGVKDLAKVGGTASYAGGIAGYNNGTLNGDTKSASTSMISSVVSGTNYVGGVVGYNDYGGGISGYGLESGYIQGKKFVGGVIGLNVSPSVFKTKTMIVSNPNEVKGDFFVGGVIGGNIVPTGTDIDAKFEADNSLGSVSADSGAFAGGFIGYNMLVSEAAKESIKGKVEAFCGDGRMDSITSGDPTKISGSLNICEALSNQFMDSGDDDYSTEAIMQIHGATSDPGDMTQVNLGSIKALAYVGGVVGYNQEATSLHIANVENFSQVEADAYVESEEEEEAEALGGTRRYSYAGGIIGKVAENVTIQNCKNNDAAEIKTCGTYTGGLAEVNYGLISDCEAGDLGDETTNYVGGIVGVNMAAEAENGNKGIWNCTVTGVIRGNHVVGGIAAENNGLIVDPALTGCTIEAGGQHVGGVTGYNHKDGDIWLQNRKPGDLDLTISGTASNVGGLVGTNQGWLSLPGDIEIENDDTSVISGQRNVGGFIGVQFVGKDGIDLERLVNRAAVQSETGYAGGIVAKIEQEVGAAGKVTISRCENYGSVEVLAAEDDIPIEIPGEDTPESTMPDQIEEEEILMAAGGITAVNYGTVEFCGNFADIKAIGGAAAGICAVNHGGIENSQVRSDETQALEISGNEYVGGIAAINGEDAKITDSFVADLILQNQDESVGGMIGGIAAENFGTIKRCLVGVEGDIEKPDKIEYEATHGDAVTIMGTAIETASKKGFKDENYTLRPDDDSETLETAVVLVSNAKDVKMGGVAGVNENVISGASQDNCSVVVAELRFKERSMDYYGYMGGIAGINGGEIRDYEFNGMVHGTANDPSDTPSYRPDRDFEAAGTNVYGYGGIAGLNGTDKGTDKGSSNAKISHCVVSLARISGMGDAGNRVNIGGIAGVNGQDGDITEIQFAEIGDKGTEFFGDYSVPSTHLFMKEQGSDIFGAVWAGADGYGHVGGVAGLNCGNIGQINWTKNYTDHRDEYFDGGTYKEKSMAGVDQTGVLVINAAGHTGGIVGYNRRTGSVENVVTGRRWLVSSSEKNQKNDGTGGIIGATISEAGLENCDNHATVSKSGTDSAGGIIGRSETASISSWRLVDCRNYGAVKAQQCAGGIIGQWKYRGGRLENCRNYGEINTFDQSTNGLGGVVGRFDSIASGEMIRLVECENHGRIGSSDSDSCGGLVGKDENCTSRFQVTLEKCINTGLIDGNGKAGGMMAEPGDNMDLMLAYCHNYGYSPSQNPGYAGMCQRADVNMIDCIGITDPKLVPHPIAEKYNAGGFYFSDSTDEWQFDTDLGRPLCIHDKENYADNFMANVRITDLNKHKMKDILLSDSKNRLTDSIDAYNLFQKLDSYLVLVRKVFNLGTPEFADGVLDGGFYTVKWKPVADAQDYLLTCQYFYGDTADAAVTEYKIYYSNIDENGNWSIQIPTNVWVTMNEQKKKADRVVLSLTAHVVTIDDKESKKDLYSDKVTKEVRFGLTLPTPQIRWELADVSNGEEIYRVVLENRADFENIKVPEGTVVPPITMDQIKISVAVTSDQGSTDVEFTAKEGAALALQSGSSAKTVTLTSYASATVTGYDQSRKVISETALPGVMDYRVMGQTGGFVEVGLAEADGADAEKIDQNIGFTGATVKDLAYNINLQSNSGTGMYYRAELMAADPELGVPVSLAVSAQTLVSPSDSSVVRATLSGLPSDFLDKDEKGNYRYQDVVVRTYPTKLAGDIVYQGKQVVLDAALSAEKLKGLCVTEYGEVAGDSGYPLLSGKTLRPGYVIERVGDDKYTLYFNALLKELLDEQGQYNEDQKAEYKKNTVTYMKNQVFYHKLDLKAVLDSTQPEPIAYANPVYDAANFIWTDGSYDGDQFVLQWDQDWAAAGSEKLPPYSQGADAPYSIDAEYRLTLTGITAMPDGSTKESVIVDNYAITTKGSDGIRKDPYNRYESTDAAKWNYTKIKMTLTRVGLIEKGKTVKFPSTVTREFPMRQRLSAIAQPTVSLARDADGIIRKDGLNYQVSWTGMEKDGEQAALDHYEVKIEGADQHVQMENTVSSDKLSIDVNLDQFKRNETVKISVRAIARDGQDQYRNGAPGAVRELTIPNRLYPPQMLPTAGGNGMTATVEPILGADEFENGCLTLNMKEDYGSTKGKYRVAFELYQTSGGSPVTIEGLPSKEQPGTMEGDLSSATYTVSGIPAKYAGCRLKVMLKAESNTNISSCWTDEAEKLEPGVKVLASRIFRLPQVQVKSVEIAEGEDGETTAGHSYQIRESVNGKESDRGEVTAQQKTLSFTTVENADNYRITMIQKPENAGSMMLASDDMQISYVNELLIEKTEDGYRGTYSSTEGGGKAKAAAEFAIPLDGSEIELPYQKTCILASDDATVDSVTLQTFLRAEKEMDGEGVTFCLTLPDFTELSAGGQDYSQWYTEQFLVQSLVSDKERYRDSALSAMMQSDGGFRTAELTEDRPEAEEPATALPAEEAGKAGYAFQLNGITGKTRYMAKISHKGKELGEYSVSFDQNGDEYEEVIWLPHLFAEYAGETLEVRFRNIYDAADGETETGGLSQWSEQVYTVDLPLAAETAGVELEQRLSPPLEHRVLSGGLFRSKAAQDVTARQSQVIWTYDLAESQIAGYDLTVHSRIAEADYHLNLDLSYNRFGQFTGLSDYLTGEGKILYTVGYDQEGDAIAYERVDTATPSDALASSSDADALYQKLQTTDPGAPTATASDSQATASDTPWHGKEKGVLYLNCVLKAELIKEDDEITGVRFILTLPDAPSDTLEGTAAAQYQEVFEDGLYYTEGLELAPRMVNRYYDVPEQEYFYLERSLAEELENDLDSVPVNE